MASNPTVPLYAARGTQSLPIYVPPLSSPPGSIRIRAPLSSNDNDPTTDGSDSETLTSAGDNDDEGFETASDPDVAAGEALLSRRAGMPIAQLTGDDDVADEEEVFEELADEGDPDSFPTVARVPSVGQDLILEDEGDVVEGEVDDPSPETGVSDLPDSPTGVSGEKPSPAENSKAGVLDVEEETPEPENPRKTPIADEAIGIKPVGAMVSDAGAVDGVEENCLPDDRDEKDGDLGLEEKESLLENATGNEAIGTKLADPVVSGAGAVDGVEENSVIDALGGPPDSKPVEAAADAVDREKAVVEGLRNLEPTGAKLNEVKKDDTTKTSGLDGNLEGAVEQEHKKPGANTDSGQSPESVSVLAAEIPELESSQSNICVGGPENDWELNEGSIGTDSELADGSAVKPDGVNVDESIESLDRGSASMDREVAEDSADKLCDVYDIKAIDKTVSPNQEIGGQTVMTESVEASIHLKAESYVPVPELASNDGDSVSVQEVESQTIIAEKSESRATERDTIETAVVAENGNSFVDYGENSTSNSLSSLEVKPVVDTAVAADDEKNNPNGGEEEEVDSVSKGLARVAILENSETKQTIKELEEGSSSVSTHSGFGSSHDYSHSMDGHIASDSDEDVLDTDEEGDGKELFDSAALAAFLKAATGASSDGSITFPSADASRIFAVDRPAGLGSSLPSLQPAHAQSRRPNIFSPSDLAVTGEPENMDEEEMKLHEKVELVRVKFFRLVLRLGHSPEDTVAAQVIYRLGLAEGIRRGRQNSRAFSFENARKKALELETDDKNDLDFSCNILVIGKSGVGKSATVNSIFGEEKSRTNAFDWATTSVKEIVGVVDGVKIRVIDTPGLRTSVMDQASNMRILSSIKKYMKRCSPDIVLYVDRMDTQTRDFNDLPLLRTITSALGSSIWFNAIVALTHAASTPPDGPNGYPLSYDVFLAQRSHVVQHSIRQAAGDMRLMNPVALVENHPSCQRNREGERVLPNGLSWRPQMLLLCYSSKILSEANSLLKLQDPSPGKIFGFRLRSPPFPYLLSSLLQSRSHPKLSIDQGVENGDSDIDLDDLSDVDKEEEEDEYDELPPFKPLRKSQIAKLTKEQRKAYFDEYDYRVKLLQKKQWKEELRRVKETKKRGKASQDDFGYGDMAEDFDQDNVPATTPVPLPDMVLPPSFDCDYPVYRYRFLEPTSQILTRPVLGSHGWDHDCGYDGVSLEHNFAIISRFPAGLSVQVTKDKKEFNIHLDSSISAKHGESGSTLMGFDIQSIGKQLAYIIQSETKFKNLKKNKTAAGVSITFLGETVATGLKIEDEVSIGKRVSLVASTGAVRAQGDMAFGANLEARLRDKDYPIGQSLSTLGLSLLRWRGDTALGANLQSQFPVGRNSKMVVRVGLNNKLSGQVTIRMSNSEHLQIALVGILPIAMSIYRTIWPGESSPY